MTNPIEYQTAQVWYSGHLSFRAMLDALFQHLGIAEADLAERLHVLGKRDFDHHHQDADFSDILSSLLVVLQAKGGLTPAGAFVTPPGTQLPTPVGTPVSSPARPGSSGSNGNGSDSGGAGDGVV
jgi:hypothetical protein